MYSHCPSSFLLAFLTFLQVSVHVLAYVYAGVCVYLRCCLFVGFACVSLVLPCAFLGENILDFDVGNSDNADGKSQERVISEEQVVRGEKDGERREERS